MNNRAKKKRNTENLEREIQENQAQIIMLTKEILAKRKNKHQKIKNKHQKIMKEQGTFPRQIYQNICPTTKKHLIAIIHDFIDRWSTNLFKNLSIRRIAFRDNVVQFQFELNELYPVGHVEALEINSETIKITILCYQESNGIPFAVEIYHETVRMLEDLSKEFIKLFGKPSSISIPQTSSRQAWFLYKLKCDMAGIKFTHKELAAELHLSHGYVRQLFSIFKKEHMIT